MFNFLEGSANVGQHKMSIPVYWFNERDAP